MESLGRVIARFKRAIQ